jgi:hypothetical protein
MGTNGNKGKSWPGFGGSPPPPPGGWGGSIPGKGIISALKGVIKICLFLNQSFVKY